MRGALKSCLLFGIVWLVSLTLLAQQPPKSPAPPKKTSSAAKAPAKKVVPPPPAPNATRLYLAFSGYDAVLLLRPPADSPGSCLSKTEWTRKLEGDLTGTQYTISLKARSEVSDSSVPDNQVPPGKILASLLIKRPGKGPLPAHYLEKYREWAKTHVEPDAPPMPDPQDSGFYMWSMRHIKRPSPIVKADPVKDPEGFRKEMDERSRMAREAEPPNLSALDSEFRKQGLPVRGEILLARTTFDTQPKERPLTATLEGPDPETLPGDELVLSVEHVEGYSCVSTESDGSVYVDIPATPLTENSTDTANRVYVITGTLVTKAGAPVAAKEVLFLPVDAEGNGLTTFGPPSAGGRMHMTNPRAKTNAQGRFTLRVAARFFQDSADPTSGRVQPVEPMGGGRLRHLGKGIDVKLKEQSADRIDLGRVIVSLR